MTSTDQLARELAAVKRQVRVLQRRPQLGQSSFEGSLEEYDEEGNLVQIIGAQPDGTHTVTPVNGPVPPAPAGLSATAFSGGAQFHWGGGFVDAVAPMDFSRVELHMSQQQGFSSDDPATLVRTWESPRGGSHDVIVSEPGIWYAKMFTRTQSGKRSVDSAELTIEIFSDALAPPEASPGLRITGAETSLIVQAEAVAPSDLITYHISTVSGFEPTTETALGEPTRSTVLVVTHDAAGARLDPSTTYYLRTVASNGAGQALPGLEAEGALDQTAAEELVASILVAGFILTGRIQIGNATFDADTGITLPQPDGGVIHLPVNGTDFATITAHALLKSATVEGDLNLYGLTQLIGRFRLTNGITRPVEPPTMTTSWRRLDLQWDDALAESVATNGYGLAERIDGYDWVTTASHEGGLYVATVSKSGGLVTPYRVVEGDGFAPQGGITRIGNRYYILGHHVQDPVRWFVWILDSGFQKVGEWQYVHHVGSNRRPAIGKDDEGNIVIARPAGAENPSPTQPVIRTYSLTGQSVRTPTLGESGLDRDITGVAITRADFGDLLAPRVVVSYGDRIRVFGLVSGSRDHSLEWTPAQRAEVRGLTWTGTGWHQLDPAGVIWGFSDNIRGGLVQAAYSWYSASGRETEASQAASYSWPARAFAMVQAPTPPDIDNEDLDPDKADQIRIYAGPSPATLRLQATLPVGKRNHRIDPLLVGSKAPELVNGFLGSTRAPGDIYSAVEDAFGPIVSIRGSAEVRMADFRVGPEGRSFSSRYRLAAQPIPSAIWTRVDFDGVVREERDLEYAAGIWTAVTPGPYRLDSGVHFATNATGRREARWVVNEVAIKRTNNEGAPAIPGMSLGMTVFLEAGDRVSLNVWQNSGANLDILGGQAFTNAQVARM